MSQQLDSASVTPPYIRLKMLFWGKEADFSSLGFLAAGCWGFGLWAFLTFPSPEAAEEFYIFWKKKKIIFKFNYEFNDFKDIL